MEPPTTPAWHQALAYAVTGRRYAELGHQQQPGLPVVAAFLRERWTQHPDERADLTQQHPLPADLAEGLGAAQLWAAVSALRTLLGPGENGPAGSAATPVLADRPLTAEEQRLLRDVPPHHGS